MHTTKPINDAAMPAAIVISEPIQVLLLAGDRFLAANISTIRAAASATEPHALAFRQRAHVAAAQLNPCQEDNYWIGNASLSWGGSVSQGFKLLRNATQCRFWDEWPPFFYGFNQNFFYDNTKEAQKALDIAAERSPSNAPAFKTFAAMLGVGKINNTRLAIKMLEEERDKAHDKKLREMLNTRVLRMKGLLTLRTAQKNYENKFHKKLKSPQDLIQSGILNDFPQDPLKIGYEFHDNGFHLKQMKIGQ